MCDTHPRPTAQKQSQRVYRWWKYHSWLLLAVKSATFCCLCCNKLNSTQQSSPKTPSARTLSFSLLNCACAGKSPTQHLPRAHACTDLIHSRVSRWSDCTHVRGYKYTFKSNVKKKIFKTNGCILFYYIVLLILRNYIYFLSQNTRSPRGGAQSRLLEKPRYLDIT